MGKRYLDPLLRAYFPLHFFALFRAHELYNVEPFVDLLSPPVLDLGCGDGVIANLLFGRSLEYGIDPDEAAIGCARASGYYRVAICGDAHRIQLDDASVGGIFSNCVLEHVADLPGLFFEVSRVLRPGACFVATCLSPFYYEMNPAFRFLDRPGLRWFRRRAIDAENRLHHHVSILGKDEYARLFNSRGMVLENHRYYAPERVARFCSVWDTAGKYSIPFPIGLSHAGLLVKYLHVRYAMLSNRESTIQKWHDEFSPLCYSRNETDEPGIGQILVARKS